MLQKYHSKTKAANLASKSPSNLAKKLKAVILFHLFLKGERGLPGPAGLTGETGVGLPGPKVKNAHHIICCVLEQKSAADEIIYDRIKT